MDSGRLSTLWANHHLMFEHIRSIDRPLVFLNTLLLLDVVFVPFTASVLARSLHDGAGERIAVGLYGMTLAAGLVFFAALIVYYWLPADRRARPPVPAD